VATTAWVAAESGSDLPHLLHLVGERWGVEPTLRVARLRFDACQCSPLRDYERGFVKEGVGAGGVAVLWELSGHPATDLAAACDRACARLTG
jgi:NaMN:DMB phosphoribosyltransferase